MTRLKKTLVVLVASAGIAGFIAPAAHATYGKGKGVHPTHPTHPAAEAATYGKG